MTDEQIAIVINKTESTSNGLASKLNEIINLLNEIKNLNSQQSN